MAISLNKTTCPTCGNMLTFNPETQSLDCELCAQVSDIEDDYIENIESTHIIPFQLSKNKAEDAFLRWLVRDDATTPSDIIQNTTIDLVHGLYVPAWSFDVLDNKTGKQFNALSYAGNRADIKADILQFIDNVKLPNEVFKPYEEKYTMGFDVVPLEIDKTAAWKKYVLASGSKSLHYQLESDALFTYMPVWMITYTYNQMRYIAYIDGLTGDFISSNAPIEPLIAESKRIYNMYNYMRGGFLSSTVIFFLLFLDHKEVSNPIAKLLILILVPMMFISFFGLILYSIKRKKVSPKIHLALRKKSQYDLTIRLADKK